MSLTAHLLVLTCSLAILGLPRGTAAQADPGKAAATQYELESRQLLSSKEEQRHGLQAARLSVTIAALNVPKLSIWGSIWLVIARDQSNQRSRRGGYAIGSIQIAGGIANLAWLVLAGQTLRDYKQHTGKWMTVRRARLDTAVSAVDTAFLLPGIIGGSIGIVRNRDATTNFDRRGPHLPDPQSSLTALPRLGSRRQRHGASTPKTRQRANPSPTRQTVPVWVHVLG